jgi:hypothetical protein
VGIIFLPLYFDVFTFGIICDMNFISHSSPTPSFSPQERVISPCKTPQGILICLHVDQQRLRKEQLGVCYLADFFLQLRVGICGIRDTSSYGLFTLTHKMLRAMG